MQAAIVRTRVGERDRTKKGRLAVALLVPLTIAAFLACVFAATATANPNFTWTGTSSVTDEWSSLENWEGEVSPERSTAIGTLMFPRLTSTACTAEEEEHPCYISINDLTGLSAESMKIDDGDSYLIGGEALALGEGGITASPPEGASGPAGGYVLTPLALTASQRWTVADRDGGEIEENGLLLGGALTGSGSALTIEQSNGSALIFDENDTEVGPLTLEAPDTGKLYVENGVVFLEHGELNSSDRQPVNLHDIYFSGVGAVGQLGVHAATLKVGSNTQPAGALEASSVALGSASGVIFEVRGDGATPQVDYSQLVSQGSVELGDASVVLYVAPPKAGGACPTLTQGETLTLISTTGSLSGSFGNALEPGPEIPVAFAAACKGPIQTVRIGYHRGEGTQTVTATVEAAAAEEKEQAKKHHEEEEATHRHEEEAIAKQKQEEVATYKHEEEVATKQKQEEEAKRIKALEDIAKELKKVTEEERIKRETEAAAAAAKKHEEEIATDHLHSEETAAKSGVLAAKETTKPRTTRAQLLAKALKACGKQPTKRRRAQCEARARKRYSRRKAGRKGEQERK
jgi:hypothetical protein